MKPKFALRNFLALAGSSLLAITSASAQTDYYWDSNSTTAGFGNTAGTWGTSTFWSTSSAGTGATANTTITSVDTVNFGTATLNYGTSNIGVAAGGVTVGGIVTGAGQTTNITLGTSGNAITIHGGITKNGSGTLTINSPITLGAAQAWTNNSAGALTLNSTLNLNGNKLTTGGSGTTSFGSAAAAVISGAGGIDATGGRLFLGAGQTPAHTYSGDTTITGGAVVMFSGNLSANSNVNINGGVLESYWSGGLTTRTIGTGTNQIRITGGESGFGVNGSTGANFNLGALTWGDTNFNPTKLLLQTQYSQGSSSLTLQSAINLNGADRTVVAHQGLTGAASSTISGAITNSTGTAGFIKEGAGLLTLSNAGNTYNGSTTISGGTLKANSTGALGNSSATNTLIFNGGTLQAGGAITSAATRSVTMNSTGIIDTNNQSVSIAGVISGAGGLTKTGNGTLTLSGANDYTGPTTLTTGTLSIGAADNLGAASSNLIFDGGTLQITGTSLNNFTSLGRTVVVNPNATLGLDINNAGNTFTFDMSLPQNGIALAGAGTVAFQNTVSSLTLNPQSGTFTYGGVIADGEAGMDLIKTGAGTQVLQGANTYTGDTFLNAGTLTLSGSGSILGTSGITFNGGSLTLTNTAAETGSGRINNNAITSNGGTLTYTNTSGANVYAETIGSVALTSGQMNFNLATNQTGAGSQTLTLSGLTRTGATNSSAVTFSAATTGPNATKNMIQVSGATETPAGEIIGAWATTGTAANNQSDYAVYDASGYVVPRNTAGSTEDTWSTAGNAYTNALAAQTLTGTRTITALRNTGTTATLTLASGNNLETSGVLNGAATLFTIAPGTGGVLTTPTGGGNLYLTTHGINTNTTGGHHGISVTAPINDNGVDAVTLVKSGVGVLQLNATSNYSGGTVLNSGTLWAQTDASLGEVNGDITFNGSATLLLSPNNGTSALSFTLPSTRSIIVNEGAMATIAGGRANAAITINGDISGSGGVTTGRVALLNSGGVGTLYHHLLLGNNTFTGPFDVGNGLETSAGGGTLGVTINSLADSTSPITLNFGSNGAFFSLGSTATADLSVPNRLVDLRNSNITIRNQDANNTMTFGSVTTTTAGAKDLKLGDGGAGGFISGAITNGAGSLSVTKSGTGTWNLSGTNTYTGATTISGGTLEIGGSGGLGGGSYNGNISIASTSSGTFKYNSTAAQTLGGVISGAGALVKDNSGVLTLTGTNTYTGTTSVNAGTLIVNGSTSVSSAVTVGAGATLGGSGTVGGATTISGLLKPGNSPGVLSFTNSLALASSTVSTFEINGAARGTEYDGVDVGTTLGLDGALVLEIGHLFGNGNYTFDLFNVTGSTSGFFDAVSFTGLMGSDSLVYDGSDIWSLVDGDNTWTFTQSSGDLNLAVIPEPGAALLGSLGLLALLRRRRN